MVRGNPQWLIVAMWAAVTLAGVLLALVPPAEPAAAIRQAATSCCGIGLSFVVTALANRALRQKRMRTGRLAIIVAVAGTTLWLLDSWIQVMSAATTLSLPALLTRRYNWVYFTLLFGLQVLVLALIASARASALQQRRLVEAQLAALRFQVNPHFLFNTLNAVATLVEERAHDAAEEMIARLAEFLRVTLSDEPELLVPLACELETIQAYLGIENVRFGERLRVDYDVGGDTAGCLVPSLILQPIVENAIKHAVAQSIGEVLVLICARVSERDLIVTVQDRTSSRISPPETTGTGVGLRNVATRLDAQFGARGKLETRKLDNGFIATLRMPIRLASEVS